MLGERSKHADDHALVLTVSREDLVAAGLQQEDAEHITDETLIDIAEKLGEALLECGYWECLKGVLEYHYLLKRRII